MLMRLAVGLSLALLAPASFASPCVQDDTGQAVCMASAAPPSRVLSLSPHLTEIVAQVGGQAQLVAVDDSSNYPAAVQSLPKIKQPWLVGTEALLAYKPDLVLVWQSGIAQSTVRQLRAAGVPVYVSEPQSVQGVGKAMMDVAQLLGQRQHAVDGIHQWQQGMASLKAEYAAKPTVSVFYQVWPQPLMTLGGQHLVSEVISLCGGRNVFDDQAGLAPTVTLEAVLNRKPQVLLASGPAGTLQALRSQWSKWNALPAVRQQHIYTIEPDILVRQGPRILIAAKRVCKVLDQARPKP